MPYDRQTWDLTAVLEAVEPGQWFGTSEQGTIRIAEDGRSSFEPSENGRQNYLTIPQERVAATLGALVARTTRKPIENQKP